MNALSKAEKDVLAEQGDNLPDQGGKTRDRALRAEEVIKKPPMVNLEEDSDGAFNIKVGDGNTEEEFEALKASLGIKQPGFFNGYLTQVAKAAAEKDRSTLEANLRFAVGFIQGVQPQDEIEAALAAQMAAVHLATMREAKHLSHCDTIQQLDVHEKTFNKLSRTFTAQMEALRKHRHGGQQKVTVQHVHVTDGGQAIVGNVTKGGGG